MTLRSHLLILVAVAVFPVLAFAGYVVVTLWQEQRAAYAESYLGNTRALAIAVDSETEGYSRALQGLVAESDPDNENSPRFVAAARRELATQPTWSSIAIADAGGKHAVGVGRNVYEPTAGFIDPSVLKAVVISGRPAVSGLVQSAAGATPVIQVVIPVVRGNAVTHVVAANVDATYWVRFLSGFTVPEAATVTLIDREGVIIARTLNNERWMGKRASNTFLGEIAKAPLEGKYRSTSLEGVPFQTAHRRARSGWIIGIGIPMSEIEAALHRPTIVMSGIALAALLLAVLAALYVGRRIALPVASLADSAQALARGAAPATLRSHGITEVEGANRAFAEASQLLNERQDALNESLARERQARTGAEGANRAKDEFLAMLGHELRNPLHAITAAMAVIDRVPPASPHAVRSREIVVRQAHHLTDLVDDLLDVARVTSGKIVLDRKLIELGRIVRRSVAVLQEAGRVGDHPVDLEIGEAWISGDETRIEQIAVNLVENAVKYTPPGRRIRVRVTTEGNEAVFEVSDEGEGIAPELLPRIFELFIQGERTLDRAQGGLGLGLTLVKNLVELHTGRVTAQSEGIGKGARFVVRLPRANAPEREVSDALAVDRDSRALRVLVVEDNADSAETLRTLLTLRGHEVDVAHDGPHAVERALATHPDVALVDIGLPIFDGFEVARQLRAAPGGDAIRLVALTGYGQPEDRKAASASGFDSFLVKPVDLNALSELLTRY
ncbi:Sensor histidine kinase RcsC [Usitatibacter rugosus]|uniref:histidine kinase n=1 Tax=Usitatibacter rugosus TaxID=2732067 RepID=A0A6M4GWE8_9PROT|nr:ATP-binding protein [Usitatibacter rugosus]QJR11332.1 Sensor histidine kinase RcsC [Usitatibacter rugosus]